MRRTLVTLAALLVFAGAAAPALRYPVVENKAWALGERLTYAIKYGPLRAGTSVLAVEDEITVNGRRCYRIRSTSNSADWFFYRVRDSIVSYVDRDGLFSWRYEKYQREGNYRTNEVAVFNHETRRVARNDDGVIFEPQEIEPFTHDILGALYYVRTQPLAVGDTLKFPVHDGRKSYTMEVSVLKRERIKVPAGEFDCLLLEPKLQSEGIFLSRGRLFVWLSTDARRLPVRVKTTLPIGAIVASLESCSGVAR